MSNQAAQELQSFVRRIESVEDEINALNADKSEIYKEAKANGYTTKTIRKVVAARRVDASEREEADAEFELYWNAVHGIETGLVRAHVENNEEFPSQPSPKAGSNLTVTASPEPLVDSQVAPIQPETANELPPASRGIAGEDDLRELAATVPGQIAQEGDAPLEASTNVTGEGMSGHAEHLSTEFTPETANEVQYPASHATSEWPETVSRSGGVDGTVRTARTEAAAVTAGETATLSLADKIKKLRPLCQRPSACGSSGGKNHCHSCMKASEAAQVSA